MECVGFTQDVATYVKEQVVPKASSLEFSMIALPGGFSEEESGGIWLMYSHNHEYE